MPLSVSADRCILALNCGAFHFWTDGGGNDMADTAKRAWLTIDDAPTEDFRQRVDELNARGIRAVWFCLGERLERYPEEAVHAVRNGHILGNHSYDHPAFSKLSLGEAREQIARTERLLDGIYARAGVPRPVKLFRFPYLDDGGDIKRDELQSLLRGMGFEQPGFPGVTYPWWKQKGRPERIDVGCTYDTWDWRLQEGGEMLPELLARMDEHAPEQGKGLNDAPGSNEVIMMHAWIPMDAFRLLLDRLQAKPLRFDPPVHLTVQIRPAAISDLPIVHPFQCDYLHRESAEDWKRRLADGPGMYLAAFAGEDLAGVCYGQPSRRRRMPPTCRASRSISTTGSRTRAGASDLGCSARSSGSARSGDSGGSASARPTIRGSSRSIRRTVTGRSSWLRKMRKAGSWNGWISGRRLRNRRRNGRKSFAGNTVPPKSFSYSRRRWIRLTHASASGGGFFIGRTCETDLVLMHTLYMKVCSYITEDSHGTTCCAGVRHHEGLPRGRVHLRELRGQIRGECEAAPGRAGREGQFRRGENYRYGRGDDRGAGKSRRLRTIESAARYRGHRNGRQLRQGARGGGVPQAARQPARGRGASCRRLSGPAGARRPSSGDRGGIRGVHRRRRASASSGPVSAT